MVILMQEINDNIKTIHSIYVLSGDDGSWSEEILRIPIDHMSSLSILIIKSRVEQQIIVPISIDVTILPGDCNSCPLIVGGTSDLKPSGYLRNVHLSLRDETIWVVHTHDTYRMMKC
jgi:hypothetical protein